MLLIGRVRHSPLGITRSILLSLSTFAYAPRSCRWVSLALVIKIAYPSLEVESEGAAGLVQYE